MMKTWKMSRVLSYICPSFVESRNYLFVLSCCRFERWLDTGPVLLYSPESEIHDDHSIREVTTKFWQLRSPSFFPGKMKDPFPFEFEVDREIFFSILVLVSTPCLH